MERTPAEVKVDELLLKLEEAAKLDKRVAQWVVEHKDQLKVEK